MSRREVSGIRVSLYHQTVYDVFGNNGDLNEACINNTDQIVLYSKHAYHEDYSIAEILHGEARNQIITLLRTEKDFSSLSKISDIAVEYSKKWMEYSTEVIDSSKLNLVLPQLSEKKMEFTLRRYYYLQDKHQVLHEMRLEDNEFEKMKNEIELAFELNTIKLVELLKGLELRYLTKHNEKIYTELAYLGDDSREPYVSKSQQSYQEYLSIKAIVCFIGMGILLLISFILKLISR